MDEYITGLLYVNVTEGYLMERYASREPFGFVMAVLGSTRRHTTVNKLSAIAVKSIMIPSFVSLDMFDLVVPYFSV